MRYVISMILCLHVAVGVAQIRQPVKWQFSTASVSEDEAILYFTATIEDGWHIYSQFLEGDGPMPTLFTFSLGKEYYLVDKVREESKPIKTTDPNFNMQLAWFEKIAVFSQKVRLTIPATTIEGKVEFMACSQYQCLAPEQVPFSVQVSLGNTVKARKNSATQKQKLETIREKEKAEVKNGMTTHSKDTALISLANASSNSNPTGITRYHSTNEYSSLWSLFVAGLLAGVAAVFMPCIFPMLPFTVSYFLKRSRNRRASILLAGTYGISIILIYVLLGLTTTILFGTDALNDLSTNGVFNFICFLLLTIFGASFLGAFEITLPSSWVTKADAQSDRKGFAGIFFMAATLALISFSCTGPLIGTLLVNSVNKMGSILPPVAGMLGFSLALALPFTLFAMFPSWLKVLPKSGSWLNSVKVVLGFLELALALKFLSNVDLAYHWKIFDREVFLVLWIVIFSILGFYLLGKVKFSNENEVKDLSPARLFLAIAVLAFSLYMVPGLWGAPLKAIAAFLPPQQSQDFDLYTTSRFTNIKATEYANDKKYSDLFKAPHNLEAFFDYNEGMEYARKSRKPVLLDFTGHACVNCRKMETAVWPQPGILEKIQDKYVLIQLYVDDKTELPEKDQAVSKFSGKKITTIGNKWSDLQATVFNTNSQPYYVLLSPEGDQLVSPKGADYDVEKFKLFLQHGIDVFEKNSFSN